VLDIELPDVTGDQVALKIRQDATNPNQATPIIAVTAHANEEFMPHWREYGINKICMKPFLETHFLQVMEELVPTSLVGYGNLRFSASSIWGEEESLSGNLNFRL
jgi:CheY-like chemotaxis protein